MIMLYMLLLVGCSLYVNGADPDSPVNRKAILEKWGGKAKNLSNLSDNRKYLQQAINKYTATFGKPEESFVLCTNEEKELAKELRGEFFGLARDCIRDDYKQAEQIMGLVSELQRALLVYALRKGEEIVGGITPRTYALWGEIRAVHTSKHPNENIFIQLAEQKLAENEDIHETSRYLMDLSTKALNANNDEASLMIMLMRLGSEHIDVISPRTVNLHSEIVMHKMSRKELLEQLP